MIKKYKDLNASELLEVNDALHSFLDNIKQYDEVFKYLPEITCILNNYEKEFEEYNAALNKKQTPTVSKKYIDSAIADYATLSLTKQVIENHKRYCNRIKSLISNNR